MNLYQFPKLLVLKLFSDSESKLFHLKIWNAAKLLLTKLKKNTKICSMTRKILIFCIICKNIAFGFLPPNTLNN